MDGSAGCRLVQIRESAVDDRHGSNRIPRRRSWWIILSDVCLLSQRTLQKNVYAETKKHDSRSQRGSGRGLYANVDQSPLSGRGHVTPLDQWGPYDVELSFSYYYCGWPRKDVEVGVPFRHRRCWPQSFKLKALEIILNEKGTCRSSLGV